MGLGILGIVSGAGKVIGKLFSNIKAKKEAKIEKKAQAIVDQKTKLDSFSARFGFTPGIVQQSNDEKTNLLAQIGSLINPTAGSMAVSGAGNVIGALKGDEVVTASNVALKQRNNGSDPNKMMLIIGGALLLLLVILKKK